MAVPHDSRAQQFPRSVPCPTQQAGALALGRPPAACSRRACQATARRVLVHTAPYGPKHCLGARPRQAPTRSLSLLPSCTEAALGPLLVHAPRSHRRPSSNSMRHQGAVLGVQAALAAAPAALKAALAPPSHTSPWRLCAPAPGPRLLAAQHQGPPPASTAEPSCQAARPPAPPRPPALRRPPSLLPRSYQGAGCAQAARLPGRRACPAAQAAARLPGRLVLDVQVHVALGRLARAARGHHLQRRGQRQAGGGGMGLPPRLPAACEHRMQPTAPQHPPSLHATAALTAAGPVQRPCRPSPPGAALPAAASRSGPAGRRFQRPCPCPLPPTFSSSARSTPRPTPSASTRTPPSSSARRATTCAASRACGAGEAGRRA